MTESHPPVEEGTTAQNCFVRFAARLSVIAPLGAILLYILFGFLVVSGHAKFTPIEMIMVGLLAMLLVLSGFVAGILALALGKRHEHKGIFGKAIVGLCLNSLLLLLVIVPLILLPHILGQKFPTTPQARLDEAVKELTAASTDENRFYALDDAAKESFNVGKIEDARNYATELLVLAPQFRSDWNYGNAIQDGNLVLGRIAVRAGRIEDGKMYLLKAGNSPGSPQMDSFGPNMSLAKDLLEKGDRDTVLQYFELCRKFWTMDNGNLDQWGKEVKAGKIPDFGANLVY
ncbi:MAG TPA: hypothetical protein VJT54_15535 [Verrucomicrobiae bacterium]|nr:hypothetical protein [Verrucomicrobiae bacterium]